MTRLGLPPFAISMDYRKPCRKSEDRVDKKNRDRRLCMEIELSEDLQHYKESLVLGLTAKQFLFSALALGVGTGIVLLFV